MRGDSRRQEPTVWRDPGRGLERAAKVGLREPRYLGEVAQAHVCREVGSHVFGRPPQLPGCEPLSLRALTRPFRQAKEIDRDCHRETISAKARNVSRHVALLRKEWCQLGESAVIEIQTRSLEVPETEVLTQTGARPRGRPLHWREGRRDRAKHGQGHTEVPRPGDVAFDQEYCEPSRPHPFSGPCRHVARRESSDSTKGESYGGSKSRL